MRCVCACARVLPVIGLDSQVPAVCSARHAVAVRSPVAYQIRREGGSRNCNLQQRAPVLRPSQRQMRYRGHVCDTWRWQAPHRPRGVRVSGTGAGDQSREHYMRTDVALRIGPTSGCGLGFTSARTRVQICTGTRHETACCTASHINRVSQVALGGLVPLQHIITQTRRTVCEWMCK